MNFWVPVGLGLFKLSVLIAAVFFSIKSHRDGEKAQKRKKEADEQRAANASDPALKVDV